jgi:hypothetical protein
MLNEILEVCVPPPCTLDEQRKQEALLDRYSKASLIDGILAAREEGKLSALQVSWLNHWLDSERLTTSATSGG